MVTGANSEVVWNKTGNEHILMKTLVQFFVVSTLLVVVCGGRSFAQAPTALQYFAAGQSEVEATACKKRMPITDSEIQAWIDKSTKNSVYKTASVGTFNFVNESSFLLNLFEFLQPKQVLLLQRNYLDTFTPPPSYGKSYLCTKVLCALKEIYGQENSLRILYILGEFGYNTANAGFQGARPFTLDELNVLTTSLSDIPVFLRKKKQNAPLFVVDTDGPYGNANIELFKGWTQLDSWQKNYVVYHEASHNLAEFWQKLDKTDSWIEKSGWPKQAVKKDVDFYDASNWVRDSAKCISGYACKNPVEYFAESFASYRYSAEKLKKINPEVYDYLKSLYKDTTYINDSGCKDSHPEYVTEHADYLNLVSQFNKSFTTLLATSPNFYKQVYKTCSDQITNGVPYNFKEARKIDRKVDECISAQMLNTVKISSSKYTSDEIILGVNPIELLRKFMAK